MPNLISEIHTHPAKFELVITGGGASAISHLLAEPGASNSLLNAVVPYGSHALTNYLGSTPESACAEKTARQMASRAYLNALKQDEGEVLGVAATAAIQTNRQRRGSDRIHVAIQTQNSLATFYLSLAGDESRQQQEATCAEFIIQCIAGALKLVPGPDPEQIVSVDSAWDSLFAGQIASTSSTQIPALFPGAFNPPHEGHFLMRQVAEIELGVPVTFELSIENVDKPPLDFIDMQTRQDLLQGHPLIFTRAPTFLQKSELFPGTVFVVGVDTLIRIDDNKYYQHSDALRDEAIHSLAVRGHKFLVFGRRSDDGFLGLQDVLISDTLRSLCREVTEAQFRKDISSTELRQRQAAEATDSP